MSDLNNEDISDLFKLMSNHIKDLGLNRVLRIYQALDEVKKVNHVDVMVMYILAVVSNYYAISIEELETGGTRECTEAKKLAMYFLKRETLSLSWIGNRFNGLSKGTTHRHISDVEAWLSDPSKYPDITDKVSIMSIQLKKFKTVIATQYLES